MTLVPAIALSNRGLSSEATEPILADSHGAIPMVAAPLTAHHPGESGKWAPTNEASNLMVTAKRLGSHHQRHGLDNDTYVVGAVSSKWAKGTGGPSGDEAQNLVAFAQNTRDEVRLIDGDGGQVGALAAQPEMKQQSYVAFTQEQEPKWDSETFGTLGTYNGRKAGVSSLAAGVRRLTPTECERLQGFPDGWTAGQSDSTRYRQLGNAVAVPVVEWIARRMTAK